MGTDLVAIDSIFVYKCVEARWKDCMSDQEIGWSVDLVPNSNRPIGGSLGGVPTERELLVLQLFLLANASHHLMKKN